MLITLTNSAAPPIVTRRQRVVQRTTRCRIPGDYSVSCKPSMFSSIMSHAAVERTHILHTWCINNFQTVDVIHRTRHTSTINIVNGTFSVRWAEVVVVIGRNWNLATKELRPTHFLFRFTKKQGLAGHFQTFRTCKIIATTDLRKRVKFRGAGPKYGNVSGLISSFPSSTFRKRRDECHSFYPHVCNCAINLKRRGSTHFHNAFTCRRNASKNVFLV